MSDKAITGGRAFARQPIPGQDGAPELGQRGMFLIDYLAAHAPAMPEYWFKPAFDAPCPPECWIEDHSPDRAPDLSLAVPTESQAIAAWGEDGYYDFNALEIVRWHQERDVQRLQQWPYAWAAEQIKQRARVLGAE